MRAPARCGVRLRCARAPRRNAPLQPPRPPAAGPRQVRGHRARPRLLSAGAARWERRGTSPRANSRGAGEARKTLPRAAGVEWTPKSARRSRTTVGAWGRRCSVLALALALSLAAPLEAFAQTRERLPVTVENDVSNPVPISIVPATRICADPACPTVVRNESDLNPFHWTRRLTGPSSHLPLEVAHFDSETFAVPDGMRLVIEYVSARGHFPEDLILHDPVLKKANTITRNEPVGGVLLRTPVSGTAAEYSIPFAFQGVRLGPAVSQAPGDTLRRLPRPLRRESADAPVRRPRVGGLRPDHGRPAERLQQARDRRRLPERVSGAARPVTGARTRPCGLGAGRRASPRASPGRSARGFAPPPSGSVRGTTSVSGSRASRAWTAPGPTAVPPREELRAAPLPCVALATGSVREILDRLECNGQPREASAER